MQSPPTRMRSKLPASVELVEVGPRDGLQNQRAILPTSDKLDLITRAIDAGVRRIEVASFVHPARVPQMADAEAVCAALPRRSDVSYIGLVLNERGLERACNAGVDEVNMAVVASETFSQRNQGQSIAESMTAWGTIASRAKQDRLRRTLTIGAAFGCPFEGEVPVERLVRIATAVAESEPDEIALADTIGVGTPMDVRERVQAVKDALGDVPLRCHFHNTRNTGIANAFAAVEMGVQALDASVGGFGGCPFAPAATGNIPTEDLVYMLHRMGVRTGAGLHKLLDVPPWLGSLLGETAPGLVWRAGAFPRV